MTTVQTTERAKIERERAAARALADSVTAYFNKRGWSHAIQAGNDDILAMSEALSEFGAVEQLRCLREEPTT